MSDALRVELFVEDHAHEALLVPFVERVAQEEGIKIRCQVQEARGGHARAIRSFKQRQILLEKGVIGTRLPDLLMVAIDGNCSGLREATKDVERATRAAFATMLVPACPDPHIERWYLADPPSFHDVVGIEPRVGPQKCARDHYKQILATAVADGGRPSIGGVEFARELVDAMDLYRAGR